MAIAVRTFPTVTLRRPVTLFPSTSIVSSAVNNSTFQMFPNTASRRSTPVLQAGNERSAPAPAERTRFADVLSIPTRNPYAEACDGRNLHGGDTLEAYHSDIERWPGGIFFEPIFHVADLAAHHAELLQSIFFPTLNLFGGSDQLP